MRSSPRIHSYETTCEDDFESLLALRIAAMRPSLERIGRFDPDRARARLRAGFSPEHTRWIVVEGERVGFLTTRIDDNEMTLEHLYLRPDSQGRGIGSAVVGDVIREADILRCELTVEALRESAANEFYLRHGFALESEDEFDLRYRRLPAIREIGPDRLAEYVAIPSKVDVIGRWTPSGVAPIDVSWRKDYDAFWPLVEAPNQFDVTNWGFLVATAQNRHVGGAIIAFRCQGYDLLEGRDDLAHVVDLRVHPDSQRRGLGALLWRACEAWSRQRGAIEMRVETQDVNVVACEFYRAMGCRVHSISPGHYGPEFDEAQIIWTNA